MKLLVGYDGSNSAKEALSLAFKHAKAFKATLDIVTSMETGTVEEAGQIDTAKKELDYAEASAKDQGKGYPAAVASISVEEAAPLLSPAAG